jgi:hypothetical protein
MHATRTVMIEPGRPGEFYWTIVHVPDIKQFMGITYVDVDAKGCSTVNTGDADLQLP